MNKALILAMLCAANLCATTYFTCTSGNSSLASTWSLTSGGACGAGVPGNGDTFTVQTTHTLSVDSNLTIGTSAAAGTDAITQNGHGKIQVLAGIILKVRGDWTWNPTDSTDRALTLAAGSVLEFDASLASSPSTTVYSLHGTSTYNYTAITANGSSGSHVTIRSNAGGANAYLNLGIAGVQYGGGLTATYTDFLRIGDAAHNLTTIWTSPSFVTGNDWNVTNSTFTNGGAIDGGSSGAIEPDGSTWIHQHNVHAGTLGGFSIKPSFNTALTSGTRSVTFNVFDKPFGGPDPSSNGAVAGMTIEDNYFGGGFISDGVAASWTRNLSRVSAEDGSDPGLIRFGTVTGGSNIVNSYLLIDDVANGHWVVTVQAITSTSLTVSGNVMDSSAPSNVVPGIGVDGLVNTSTTSGQTTSYHHNLILPGADGNGIGALVDTISSLHNITNLDHNTGFTTPFGTIEYELEIPPSGVGNRGSIINTISADLVNAGSPVNFFILQSHCPPTTNVITDAWDPTAIHHNGIYGMALTQATCSSTFTNQANSAAGAWSSTPNGVGLVSANPNFVDPTRAWALFDSAYLGNSYPAYSPGSPYTKGSCVSFMQSTYYYNKPVNYCAKVNLTGSEANSTPGTGTASRQYWEMGTNKTVRNAVATGLTITDAGLGLSGATYIQAAIAWVRAGYAPTNTAYHNTASDGSDIGAVPFTSGGGVPVVSGACAITGTGSGAFPCIDDVSFNGGYSCARFTWQSDVAPTGQRIQFGSTSAYGSVMSSYGSYVLATKQQLEVCGNTPGSTVHFCAGSQNGSGWSSCSGLDQTVTFPSAPTTRIAALPTVTAQPYPDTTGFQNLGTLDGTCSNFASLWATASTHSNAHPGYFIYMPHGQTCPGIFTIPTPNEGTGGIQAISPPSHLSTFDGTITINGHGFTLNQTVYVDATLAGVLPPELKPQPVTYFVVNPTTNTFQLAATASGSPIVPSVTGSSIWVSPTVLPYRSTIVFRSDAADSALPPAGVRVDPSAWASSYGVLQAASLTAATIAVQPFAHDIHFGPGIELTRAPSSATATNKFDPQIQYGPMWDQGFRQDFNYISLDRIWVRGLACPDRTQFGLLFDGGNVQVDSLAFENLVVCRPNYSGLDVTSTSSTAMSIATGTYYFLSSTNTVTSKSITISGSGSGSIFITLPPGTSAPKVYLPTGVSASCTGCVVVNSANLSDYPRDAVICQHNSIGHMTEGPIAFVSVTGGSLGSPVMALDEINTSFVCDTPTGGDAEGAEAIDVPLGPGPTMITNNGFHNVVGIAVFFEDTGAALGYPISNLLTKRNSFLIDDFYSPSNAAWNHLNACNRNMYESKSGQYEAVIGNTFVGQYGYCTPQGMAILLGSNNAAGSALSPPTAFMSDLTAAYNTISNSSGGITITGQTPGPPMPHVVRRANIHDNLIFDINAWQHTSVPPSTPHLTPGWGFYLGFNGEDWYVRHNTVVSVGGYHDAGIYWIQSTQSGMDVSSNMLVSIGQDATSNIATAEGAFPTPSTPSCGGLTGKAMFDCSWTPSYVFAANVLGAGYNNTQTQSGESSATMSGVYTGVDASNTVLPQSTVAARLTSIAFRDTARGNYGLKASSDYAGHTKPGVDGYPPGANIDALMQAQGTIQNVRALSKTTTGATIYFSAPDAGTACYVSTVLAGNADLTAAVRPAANTTASRLRSIAVTGLTTGTSYDSYVMCSGASNTPMVSFTTN